MVATSGFLFNPLGQAGNAPAGLTSGVAGFMETLRTLARTEREQRKIKLVYIAAASDRGESALSRWETGETDCPAHLDRVIDAYAGAFGMTPIELVEAVAQRMREDETGQAVEADLKPPGPRDDGPNGRKPPASRKPGAAPRPRPTGRRSPAR